MNFESLQAGFVDYLIKQEAQKQGKSEAEVELEDSSNLSFSIFLHGDEFKEYLYSEVGQDLSIFSKSIDEIMQMQIVDGKLVDAESDEAREYDEDELLEAQSLQEGLIESIEAEQNADDETTSEEIPDETKESIGQYVNEEFNALLGDEKVISTLDADGSGDLGIEEIGAFLGSININNDNKLSFDELSAGFTSIAEGKYQETYLDAPAESADNFLNRILDGVYEDEDVIKALDIDKDGKLSDEEKAKFEEFIKGYNSDGDELTEADIKRAYDDIKNGTFSYDSDLDEKAKEIDKKVEEQKAQAASSKNTDRTSPSKNTQGSSARSYSSGTPSSYNSFSSSSLGAQKTLENMTLDELEQEKSEKQAAVDTATSELDTAKKQNEAEIATAQADYDSAKDDYNAAMNQESDEVKELNVELQDNLDKIDETESSIKGYKEDINKKDREISTLESSISANKANVSSLEAAKAELEAFTSDDSEKVAQAKANAQNLQSQIDKLNAQIEQDEESLVAQKTEKQTLEDNKTAAEEQLGNLKTIQEDLKTQIEALCSEDTKKALKEMLDAQKTLGDLKMDESGVIEAAETKLSEAQKELDEVNAQISIKKNEQVEKENSVSDFDFDFDADLTDSQRAELEKFKENFSSNEDKYKAVEEATGIPAELVAAIHWRESGGNFGTYLHNGQPLGQTTTIVPKGIYFENWTDAAIDAMSNYGGGANSVDKDDINSYYDYAERYNGLGYRNKGVASPYVWSGTTNYSSGKYVRDGVYDPNTKDQQLGVAIMLQSLLG